MSTPAPQPRGGTKKCPQCWLDKPWPSSFIGAKGKPIGFCTTCRARYAGWTGKSLAERAATPRSGVPALPALRARLFLRSQNKKLGGIPTSVTSRGTCPPSCDFYETGCYATYGKLAAHWRTVGSKGDSWADFLADVRALPEGQLWRHNTAGDLPGDGGCIDLRAFRQLLSAASHTRPFSFTHKYGSLSNRVLIRYANRRGFTINLSADSLAEADRLADFDAGPVAVVLHSDTPDRGTITPKGRRVVVCPAQTLAGLTCVECRLCAHPTRLAIVGFRAHGQARAFVDSHVGRRLPVVA